MFTSESTAAGTSRIFRRANWYASSRGDVGNRCCCSVKVEPFEPSVAPVTGPRNLRRTFWSAAGQRSLRQLLSRSRTRLASPPPCAQRWPADQQSDSWLARDGPGRHSTQASVVPERDYCSRTRCCCLHQRREQSVLAVDVIQGPSASSVPRALAHPCWLRGSRSCQTVPRREVDGIAQPLQVRVDRVQLDEAHFSTD